MHEAKKPDSQAPKERLEQNSGAALDCSLGYAHQIACRPSKLYQRLISVVAAFALLSVLVAPVDALLKLSTILLLLPLVWQRLVIDANLAGRYSVCGIRSIPASRCNAEPLNVDLSASSAHQWQLKMAGRWYFAELNAESVVTASAMLLQWQVFMGGRKPKRVYSVLLPDSAGADQLRQLRIYLRF